MITFGGGLEVLDRAARSGGGAAVLDGAARSCGGEAVLDGAARSGGGAFGRQKYNARIPIKSIL